MIDDWLTLLVELKTRENCKIIIAAWNIYVNKNLIEQIGALRLRVSISYNRLGKEPKGSTVLTTLYLK